MKCTFCNKELRKDNLIGACRAHRNLSENRKSYIRKYALDNPEKIKEIKKRYSPKATKAYLERRRTDPLFKLAGSIRTRLNTALARRGKKSDGSVRNLGCTIQELKAYLESLFQTGMNWQNHGEWHIDHIIPLAKFDLSNDEELKRASHYSNLQPLWASDNIKKRDRI